MIEQFKLSPEYWVSLFNQLEPQVRELRSDGGSGAEHAIYSIAISLKRIADAMTKPQTTFTVGAQMPTEEELLRTIRGK